MSLLEITPENCKEPLLSYHALMGGFTIFVLSVGIPLLFLIDFLGSLIFFTASTGSFFWLSEQDFIKSRTYDFKKKMVDPNFPDIVYFEYHMRERFFLSFYNGKLHCTQSPAFQDNFDNIELFFLEGKEIKIENKENFDYKKILQNSYQTSILLSEF